MLPRSTAVFHIQDEILKASPVTLHFVGLFILVGLVSLVRLASMSVFLGRSCTGSMFMSIHH